MPFDSVFHSWTVSTFAADLPLIPIEQINRGLDRIEAIGDGMQATAEALTDQLLRQARGKTVAEVQELRWGFSPIVQRQLVSLWRSAWALGADQGYQEMLAAIPNEARQQALASQFALDAQTLSLIAALLTQQPGLVIPIGVEQAILQRVLTIAGNYSQTILERLKGSLIAATVPVGGQSVISRAELQRQIQETLRVSSVRAEIIARTETTYAYNQARVQMFRQSQIVSHVRFLAIDDARTTAICRSRNGMLIPIEDTGTISANKPPLHGRCRSMLSPVMANINPTHQQWADDPDRSWDNRQLVDLPKGWRTE